MRHLVGWARNDLRLVVRLAALVLYFAFGPVGCYAPESLVPGAPQLEKFRFYGQSPDSTLVLLFSFDFFDSDGDLGRGKLEVLIGDSPLSKGPLPMYDLMVDSNINPASRGGTVRFVLQIVLPDAPQTDGKRFNVSVRVQDGAEHWSNTETIGLQFATL